MAKTRTRQTRKPKNATLDFHFIKTPGYRTYHADGAIGSYTNRGGLYLEFYVERTPTPTTITQQINGDGTLGKMMNVESKKGIVREIECGVAMDLSTTKSLHAWLGSQIQAAEDLLSKGLIGEVGQENE